MFSTPSPQALRHRLAEARTSIRYSGICGNPARSSTVATGHLVFGKAEQLALPESGRRSLVLLFRNGRRLQPRRRNFQM